MESPWASDAIPVQPAPVEIVWERTDSGVDAPADSVGPTGSGDAGRTAAPTERPWWMRSWPVAALCAAAVLLIAVVVWPRGDDEDSSELPPISEPASTEAADTTDPTTTPATLPATNSGANGDDGEEAVGGPGPPPELAAIDLPDVVARIEQPTELVVQTHEGLVHTLSLPSGNVRTTDLSGGNRNGGGNSGGALVVSPDAALVAGFGGDTFIVPRSGPPVTIDSAQFAADLADDASSETYGVEPLGWLARSDGDVFLGNTYDQLNGQTESYIIGLDGAVLPAPDGTELSFPIVAQGQQIINDAGGVYRIDAAGTPERISTGQAIGGSAERILVRECDETRTCRYVVENTDGDDQRVVVMPDGRNIQQYYAGLSLSPDGTAAAYTDYNDVIDRTIIDLADGATIETPLGNYDGGGGAWAPDSSGEFTFGGGNTGLIFMDRSSGEATRFGEELGGIISIGVRYPDAELVETAVTENEVTFSSPPEAAVGLDLVTVGRVGGMTLIDLDDARSTSWNTPALPGNSSPQLFADDAQVLAVSGNGNVGFLSSYGSSTALDDDQIPQGRLLRGPRPGLVWARNSDGTAEIDQITLNLNGTRPTSDLRQLRLPDGTIVGGDSTGGLVVDSGGDIYVMSGGDAGVSRGIDRLTPGEILAIGATTALVRECDESLGCTTARLDRATGERTAIRTTGVPSADGHDGPDGFPLDGSMSPDGDVVLARFRSVGTASDPPTVVEKWFLFDLATDNSTGIPEPDENQPIIWNDDSSYAAFVADGNVRLYERATNTIIEVDTRRSDVRGFTAVSDGFTVTATT